MVELLLLITGIWIFFHIIGLFFTIKIIKDDIDDMPKEFDEEFNKLKVIICFTETHNDIIYVWEKESNTFLTQGKNMEEVVQYFVKNHPNTRVMFERRKTNEVGSTL